MTITAFGGHEGEIGPFDHLKIEAITQHVEPKSDELFMGGLVENFHFKTVEALDDEGDTPQQNTFLRD